GGGRRAGRGVGSVLGTEPGSGDPPGLIKWGWVAEEQQCVIRTRGRLAVDCRRPRAGPTSGRDPRKGGNDADDDTARRSARRAGWRGGAVGGDRLYAQSGRTSVRPPRGRRSTRCGGTSRRWSSRTTRRSAP